MKINNSLYYLVFLICSFTTFSLTSSSAQFTKKELRKIQRESKKQEPQNNESVKSNAISDIAKESSGSRNSAVVSTKARKTYNKLGYKVSIQELSEKRNLTTEDKIQIANAHRLNHEVENAAKWYAEVVNESDDPLHKLHYAQVLQSSGDINNSKHYYALFSKQINQSDNWSHLSTIFSINISDKDRFIKNQVELRNEKHINTNKLEFSPSMYKDGILFVSTKKPEKYPSIGKDPWIDENFMALYFAKRPQDEALVENAEPFSYDLTTKFHEGPVSFNRSGDQVYFTRNDYLSGKRTNSSEGIMRLEIYTSSRIDDGWSKPEPLPFNNKETEEAHPALSPDGMTLYFASDRDGGYGGMDIYKSEYTSSGWGDPVNLGPAINTAGNEVFPFIHESGRLFYASNGKDGLGGLDIFQSEMESEEWKEATNIGTPFNSIKDDFGFVLNEKGTYGYLTSARKGGYGRDDIYSFILEEDVFKSNSIRICTFEEPSGDKVPNAELIIKEQASGCNEPDNACYPSILTDIYGYAEASFNPDKYYNITIKKEGYQDEVLTLLGSEILNFKNDEYCFPLHAINNEPSNKIDCVELETTVVNKETNNPVSYASVTLLNKCNNVKVEYLTDERGHLNLGCIPCNCDFELIGSKPRMGEDVANTSTINIPCTKENKLSKILKLSLDTPTSATPEFIVGDIIVLDNIYYDFDQYYIRDDAAVELDRVVTLMQRYPTMIIELGSHTDARATYQYNETLSSNRAQAAVEYIVSRGIDSRRLVAKGYGETLPRNECKDFVECSEEQHQFNRRTEIKVIQFNEKEIEVQYEDKGPQRVDRADPSRKWVWK